jgi:hypothetical protein
VRKILHRDLIVVHESGHATIAALLFAQPSVVKVRIRKNYGRTILVEASKLSVARTWNGSLVPAPPGSSLFDALCIQAMAGMAAEHLLLGDFYPLTGADDIAFVQKLAAAHGVSAAVLNPAGATVKHLLQSTAPYSTAFAHARAILAARRASYEQLRAHFMAPHDNIEPAELYRLVQP